MHASHVAEQQLAVCLGAAGAVHGDRGVDYLLL